MSLEKEINSQFIDNFEKSANPQLSWIHLCVPGMGMNSWDVSPLYIIGKVY